MAGPTGFTFKFKDEINRSVFRFSQEFKPYNNPVKLDSAAWRLNSNGASAMIILHFISF